MTIEDLWNLVDAMPEPPPFPGGEWSGWHPSYTTHEEGYTVSLTNVLYAGRFAYKARVNYRAMQKGVDFATKVAQRQAEHAARIMSTLYVEQELKTLLG